MLARSGTCILALAKLGTPTTYVTPQCGLVSLSGVLRLGVRLTAGAFFFFFASITGCLIQVPVWPPE